MKPHLPLALLCLLLAAPDLPAVVSMQTDTFSTSDPAGWIGGQNVGAAPPTVTPGGPTGDFLTISSSAFHLGMKNQAQWAGDYLAAGVTAIEADILSDPSLTGSMRIFLFGPGGTWSNQSQVTVPAGIGWNHYSFGLSSADLVFVPAGPNPGPNDPGEGTMTLNDTLASVQTVLFRHNTPAFPSSTGSHADHVTATLGFDNITAVPEPTALLLSLIAGIPLLLHRRRHCCA